MHYVIMEFKTDREKSPIIQVSDLDLAEFVKSYQTVPEFGSIVMITLAVAIISIILITTKSRIIPRFQKSI